MSEKKFLVENINLNDVKLFDLKLSKVLTF